MALTFQVAEEIVKNSLFEGYLALKKAGEEAKQIEDESKLKDIVTKGDKIVGQAMLDHIKSYGEQVVVYSEEIPKTVIGNNPDFSVIYDDIDGTDNFKTGRSMLPYGPIIGVFDKPNPAFKDCISAGFLEFNSGNLYYATKNKGAYVINSYAKSRENGERIEPAVKIKTSDKKEIKGLKIANDQYMLGKLAGVVASYSAGGHWLKDFASEAVHLAYVAEGVLDIFVSGNYCSNKAKKSTGEALGPGYLIIKEAGGSVLDWEGRDIGKELIGLDEKKVFNFVAGANQYLVKSFVKDMNKHFKDKIVP
jgi:fructose-1,6-bisphosphatase/inositol monophosphatase family enzyme